MAKVNLSIIIPCYNEGSTFTKSVDKIVQELKNINLGWEIIFVEDKSTDDTKSAVEILIKGIKNARAILRFLASKTYAIAVKYIVDIPVEDTEAGYKFFRKAKILPILAKVKSKHWFWDTEICALAHWNGLSITQIPVLFKRRYDKKSTVRLIPDTIDYIKNLIRIKSQMYAKK